MPLTAAHWVYLAGVLLIVAATAARRTVLVPALAASAATAWTLSGSPVTAIQALFRSVLTAAVELFDIFLIIAVVTALLGALRAVGADQRMVMPFRAVMRGGWSAWIVLIVVTFVVSLFFWPTPAVPLIGAILVPVAIRAGLPAMAAGAAIAIAGQGMALSSDYVIKVAPGVSATAAGVQPADVADAALVLSLVTGGVALLLVSARLAAQLRTPSDSHPIRWESTPPPDFAGTVPPPARRDVPPSVRTAAAGGRTGAETGAETGRPIPPDCGERPVAGADADRRTDRRSRVFAAGVPIVFGLMVVYLVLGETGVVPPASGRSAAALVGGLALVLVVLACVPIRGPGVPPVPVGEHIVDGLVFAVRSMGAVLPVAGFFFLGNAEFAGDIMGTEPGRPVPGLLVDLVAAAERFIPDNPVVLCFAVLIVGLLCGLEGSGFSGLPLTGSLAGALGPAVGMDPATLAAVGQMGSVWAGGGVLVPWSSLLVVAGVLRVPAADLARRCFLPVLAGLVVSTLVAALLLA